MPHQPRLRWAVLGVGTAGKARVEAIEKDERAVLVAVWRGRFAAQVEAPVVESLEAAISAADCVAVCSPDAAHAAQVRAALEAGRHVVCEYPLAQDPQVARELFDLARARQRVLHVEHIELLGAVPQTLRALVRPEVVERVEIAFDRAGSADAERSALAWGNVARLHRVVDVAGPFVSIDDVTHEPGELRAALTLASGAPVLAVFRQQPTLGRRTRLLVATPAATWEQSNDSLTRNGTPQTLLSTGSLFKRDQAVASARILDGARPYVSDARIVHVLDVIDRLARGERGPVAPPA